MLVWGLGTWRREVGTYGAGTRGHEIILGDAGYNKVRGKFNISFFAKICCLWSTLDSIVHAEPHPYDVYTRYLFI